MSRQFMGTTCDDTITDQNSKSRYHQDAGVQISNPSVKYHQLLPDVCTASLRQIVQKTPKPKGHTRFSTIEVVHQGGPLVERMSNSLWLDHQVPIRFHELPETGGDPAREYNAIFEIETRMMLAKANRQSLVIWAGHPDKPELDGFAGFLGMLPFRGISVALVTFSDQYPDPFRYATPSGVLEHDSRDAGRMGLCPIKAVFGALPSSTFTAQLSTWDPIIIEPRESTPMIRLPFRIAGAHCSRSGDGLLRCALTLYLVPHPSRHIPSTSPHLAESFGLVRFSRLVQGFRSR